MRFAVIGDLAFNLDNVETIEIEKLSDTGYDVTVYFLSGKTMVLEEGINYNNAVKERDKIFRTLNSSFSGITWLLESNAEIRRRWEMSKNNNIDSGNLADDRVYNALDVLYKRGWTDHYRGRDFDPRRSKEWQEVLDLLREERSKLLKNRLCPTCKSKGFNLSVLGPDRCTFCDGTEGGNSPTNK